MELEELVRVTLMPVSASAVGLASAWTTAS